MLKPTTKYKPNLDCLDETVELHPERQVVEVGYTPLNLTIVAQILLEDLLDVCNECKVDIEQLERALAYESEVNYLDFVALCKKAEGKLLATTKKRLRDMLPEFGYSPYNLAVIQMDLGLKQGQFAKLLGWSTPKLRQHIPANTSSSQFNPMPIGNWVYVNEVYEMALRASDHKYGIERNYDFLFLESGRGLRNPSIPSNTN